MAPRCTVELSNATTQGLEIEVSTEGQNAAFVIQVPRDKLPDLLTGNPIKATVVYQEDHWK